MAGKRDAERVVREADVRESDIRETVIVHAGSCSLSASPAAEATAKALRLGRELGKLVSFDLNYRDMMWNGRPEACAAKVREILPYVDLLKVADDEVSVLGGEEALPGLMERYGLTLVVETLGSQGAVGFFRGERIPIASRSARCVDATGAGDAFWGGFLHRMLALDTTPDQLTVADAAECARWGRFARLPLKTGRQKW